MNLEAGVDRDAVRERINKVLPEVVNAVGTPIRCRWLVERFASDAERLALFRPDALDAHIRAEVGRIALRAASAAADQAVDAALEAGTAWVPGLEMHAEREAKAAAENATVAFELLLCVDGVLPAPRRIRDGC